MISRIEALNYCCLRSVSRPLAPLQVLVGPNASGKSTFLDVVRFVSDLVSDGLAAAVEQRTRNFYDLTWGRSGDLFELVVEAAIPESRRQRLPSAYDVFRYEVAVGLEPEGGPLAIRQEQGLLVNSESGIPEQERQARSGPTTRKTTLISGTMVVKAMRRVLAKYPLGGTVHDEFFPETTDEMSERSMPFRFGPLKTALANLPEDESQFPVATWFKQFLRSDIVSYQLNGRQLRAASPPRQPHELKEDAANLPWVVERLRSGNPMLFADWLAHLQTALPDLADIRTVLREDDRHRYLMLKYAGGLEVPSWNVSEGTLRLLALTLPAYLDDFRGVLLIEEPENGLHPLAIETMYQSLSSVYDGQVLLATHSPMLVAIAEPSEVLCFTKDEEGATEIVSGDKHPELSDWRGEVDLGTLFASGVLG
jgi:predicted ATPase